MVCQDGLDLCACLRDPGSEEGIKGAPEWLGNTNHAVRCQRMQRHLLHPGEDSYRSAWSHQCPAKLGHMSLGVLV